MERENLTIGTISEQELVKNFGSPAQKKSYKENGRFVGANKKTIMSKLERYCNIEDCGNREYKISQIYKYPLPVNFGKMNKSLYQYIVPLLLTTLVNGHDKNRKIDITLGRWAREINMVNHNYTLVRYNREDTSKKIQYPLEAINEFYSKSDDMIEWYITNALDYLKSAGLIIWRDVYRINTEVSNDTISIDENANVHTEISIESHQASKEEMNFYSHCIDVADKCAGIESSGERYYSKKSQAFNTVLKSELYKRKIKCVYKTYEAYYVNLDKCTFLLSQFEVMDINHLVEKFNKEFTTLLIGNAEKRFDKSPEKYIIYNGKDDYKLCFQGLCEMVINKDTEYLGNRIQRKTLADDYKLSIHERRKK